MDLEEIYYSRFTPYNGRFSFLEVRKFNCISVIWHDGFKLAYGVLNGGSVSELIEVSTGAKVSDISEVPERLLKKYPIEKALYEVFISKLDKYNVTLAELVARFNQTNKMYVDTWQIALLPI